ncbi:MAG: hypothetical protein O9342_00770 [Beijerinckiaceae bacterium]|nr:hypothetical protein [Beijerinckiaceae bacterium]
MKIHRLALGLALLPMMAGCSTLLRPSVEFPALAEPLGQLTARTKATMPQDEALERALQAKAAAMLARRESGPAIPPATPATAPPSSAGTLPAAPPAGPRTPAVAPPGGAAGSSRPDAVAAMLARARQSAPAPAPAPAKAKPVQAEAPPAKVEARLSDPPPAPSGQKVTIRFSAGADELDSEGNRHLADLSRRTGLETGRTLILTAGLSGSAPAWERLQLASRRLETVARHVPPPLAVDRRFDPALDGNVILVTVAGAGS